MSWDEAARGFFGYGSSLAAAEPVAKDIVKLWTELKETGTSALVGEWEENAERSKG